MTRVLVIGGGASGLLVAVNLLRSGKNFKITLSDSSDTLGRGLAYSTTDPDHLLNVPAGRMSGLAEDAADLCKWAGVDEGAFIPRRDYLSYLIALLQRSIDSVRDNSRFVHLRKTVVDILNINSGYLAYFADGTSTEFDVIVVAVGNSHSLVPEFFADLPRSIRVIRDLWREPFEKNFDHVALIGTGLTFYDAALSIIRERPDSKLIAISRNGLLPQPHLLQRAPALPVPPEVRSSALAIREYLDGAGERWREAQDGIRHDLQEIWSEFPDSEKEAFLQNHFRWWNSLRHRSAPEIDQAIRASIERGQIEIVAGAIDSVVMDSDQIVVTLTDGRTRIVDQIVNCCGNQLVATQPLIGALVDKGFLSRGPLGLGVACDTKSLRLKDGAGVIHSNVYGIGPILVGELFETTAIPEIRLEAALIAKEICSHS